MSSEQTIRRGDNWHVNCTSFESNHVYLTIDNVDVDLQVVGKSTRVTLRIPDSTAKEIGIIEGETFHVSFIIK